MVAVAAIAAGYGVVAAISTWIPCLVNKAWLFFVSDQVCFFINHYFWVSSIFFEKLANGE